MGAKRRGGSSGAKGFAAMDEENKKRIASQGGVASAKTKKTANRGFASMDKNKQREISSMGGKASRNQQGQSSEKDQRSEQDAQQKDIVRDEEEPSGS